MPRKGDSKQGKVPKGVNDNPGPRNDAPADCTDSGSEVMVERDDHDPVGETGPQGSVVLGETEEERRKRREIRLAYREIVTDLHEHQHDYEKPSSTGLHDQLKKVEEIFPRVKHTREAALDSAILYRIAESGKRQAQALHADLRNFEVEAFAEQTMRFLEQYQESDEAVSYISKEGWEKLGDAVQPFFQRSPPLHFMFGSFEREPARKTDRRRPGRPPKSSEAQEKAKAPSIITNVKKKSKMESTTEEVEQVLSLLNYYYKLWEKNPICYFEFVVNPQSFGQTVENIFHVSFLIKDGLARLFLDDSKLPVIEPVEKNEGEADNHSSDRHQLIMTLTKREWQEIIKTFRIEKPLIPTRQRVSMDDDQASEGSNDSDVENRDVSQPSTSRGSNHSRRGSRRK